MADVIPDSETQQVPEDWGRALAVVAHPDDLEYGAAAAIARWTDQGKTVVYCLVTSGEAGIDSMAPDEAARMRQEEERRSASVVGVDVVEFLNHPDGLVENTLMLRRDLTAAIRRHTPDVIISMNFHDSWGPTGYSNHADHRATGRAVLDAVRDASNRWLFVGAGGAPWSGVRFAVFNGSPFATHWVDTAATIDRGVASLAEHAGYLAALPEGTTGKDPEPFIRGMGQQTGARFGVGAATTFELVEM